MTPAEHAHWLAAQSPRPSVEALDAVLDVLDEFEREREEEGGSK